MPAWNTHVKFFKRQETGDHRRMMFFILFVLITWMSINNSGMCVFKLYLTYILDQKTYLNAKIFQ